MSTESENPKKSSLVRLILVVVGIVTVEAAILIPILMFWAGPAEVEATNVPESAEIVGGDRIVETLILDAKLPNNRSGVTYIYDTEIYAQTKERYTERVREELEQFQNEIRAEISTIWRTSEPHHFQEPRLENLTRKVYALLNDRFGSAPETQEPIIEKCVIVMGTGFRVDS